MSQQAALLSLQSVCAQHAQLLLSVYAPQAELVLVFCGAGSSETTSGSTLSQDLVSGKKKKRTCTRTSLPVVFVAVLFAPTLRVLFDLRYHETESECLSQLCSNCARSIMFTQNMLSESDNNGVAKFDNPTRHR